MLVKGATGDRRIRGISIHTTDLVIQGAAPEGFVWNKMFLKYNNVFVEYHSGITEKSGLV